MVNSTGPKKIPDSRRMPAEQKAMTNKWVSFLDVDGQNAPKFCAICWKAIAGPMVVACQMKNHRMSVVPGRIAAA